MAKAKGDQEARLTSEDCRKATTPALQIDHTPTPTKLLQAVDELGLFQDDDNPFDVHFRKAALGQEQRAPRPEQDPQANPDQELNTPTILTADCPNSADKVQSKDPVAAVNRTLKRWPAVDHDESCPKPGTGRRRSTKAEEPPTSQSESVRRQYLLERNRAAATRSRAKKKVMMLKIKEENAKLTVINRALVQENKRLQAENVALLLALQKRGPEPPPGSDKTVPAVATHQANHGVHNLLPDLSRSSAISSYPVLQSSPVIIVSKPATAVNVKPA